MCIRDSEGVEALVVARSVHVQTHGSAVAREGMAVGAGGQILHDGVAAGLADVAQLPLDEGQSAGWQRLNRPRADERRNHQGDVAIEDGGAHRIRRREDGYAAGGERLGRIAVRVSGNPDRLSLIHI